ncbi:hypothetical protein K7432_018087 [Basidiobolus ranarum]|uniref:Uncharacterized protein n=1 Tax=Basidiobolus ranarum TaxID=34480 RepID=A0ABR2VJI0_9FUNG
MESNTYKQTISLNAESTDSNTYSHTSTRGTSFKSKSMSSKKKGRATIRNAQAGNTSRNDTSKDNNKAENLGKISSSASFRKRLKEKSRFIVSSEEIGNSKVKK